MELNSLPTSSKEARTTHLDLAPSFLALKLPKPRGGGLWGIVCAKVLLGVVRNKAQDTV